MASIVIDDLCRDFLTCQGCSKDFDDNNHHARLLPCLHSICFSCIHTLNVNAVLKCPICASEHQITRNESLELPRNDANRNILSYLIASSTGTHIPCAMCDDGNDATHYCKECLLFICCVCHQQHERLKPLRNHILISLENISSNTSDIFDRPMYCEVIGHHGEKINKYCESESCKIVICDVCAKQNHRTHDVRKLSDVFTAAKKDVEVLLNKVNQEIDIMERKISEINLAEKKTSRTTKMEKIVVQKVFGDAKRRLDEREREICAKIEQLNSRNIEDLEKALSKVYPHLSSCRHACTFINHAYRVLKECNFLNIRKLLLSHLSHLQKVSFANLNASGTIHRFKRTYFDDELHQFVCNLGQVVKAKSNANLNSTFCAKSASFVGDRVVFNIHLNFPSLEVSEPEDITVLVQPLESNDDIEPKHIIVCKPLNNSLTQIFSGNWTPENAGEYVMQVFSNCIALSEQRIQIGEFKTFPYAVKKDIVVVLKIGEEHAGIALSTRNGFLEQPLKKIVTFDGPYVPNQIHNLEKVPSCVLLNPSKEINSFGYEAIHTYLQLKESSEENNWYFFRTLKTQLSHEKKLEIQTVDGKVMEASDVVNRLVRCMTKKVFDQCSIYVQDTIYMSIVGTSIMDEKSQKLFMQSLAMAGIKKDKMSVVVSEPEAVGVYCRYAKEEWRKEIGTSGHQYLILDCGGSSVQMTIHEVQDEYTKRTVLHERFDGIGGNNVDMKFQQLLTKIFGAPILQQFKEEFPMDHYDFWNLFRRKKKKYDIRGEKSVLEYLTIPVPQSLIGTFEEITKERTRDAIKDSNLSESIRVHSGRIRIRTEIIQNMFLEAARDIVMTIQKPLREYLKCKSMSTIIMVGGFSNSKTLQEMIQKEFPHISVIIPDFPELVSLRGSVLLAREEKI